MISLYTITNKLNGKMYVGQTSDVERRIKSHFTGKGAGLIKRAVRKYGEDSFTHRVVHECVSREGANLAEQVLIEAFGTLAPGGYNITPGGTGGDAGPIGRAKISRALRVGYASGKYKITEAMKRSLAKGRELAKTPTEKQLAARSEVGKRNKGRKRTPEQLAAWKAAQKEHGISIETRAKLSAVWKGRKQSAEHKAKRAASRKATLAAQGRTR